MGSFAILGPGGVGGFLAAALARAGHPVTVVARESTAEHIANYGIEVQSRRLGDFTARPEAGAEVAARICPTEAQALWSKLVRLNALALTTSACDRPVGFIRTDPEWRSALKACIEEAAAVARADGAEMDPAARLAELNQAHPEL